MSYLLSCVCVSIVWAVVQYLGVSEYISDVIMSLCCNKATSAGSETFIYVVSQLAGPHGPDSGVTYIFLLYSVPCTATTGRHTRHESFAPNRPTFPRAPKHRRDAESVSQFAQICVRVRLCVWSSPYGGTS